MDENSLSERELRILAEIEERLHEEDPSLGKRFRDVDTAGAKKKLRFALPGVLVGLVLLFAFTANVVYGIVGFAVLLLSVAIAVYAIVDITRARVAKIPRVRLVRGRPGPTGDESDVN